MAGKRQTSTIDHMMFNKLSRMEVAPQFSIPFPGKTAPKDLQTCQNFITYSLPCTEGQISSSPWSSAAAYRQYEGNALSQHVQTSRVSNKCQRPEAEILHNPLQLSNHVNNHFSVHQSHPIHSYNMSSPRPCPPIVMPRPVYRSPSGFMDSAYGTLGVCVGSQPLCPPAIEWSSSTGFAYPPSTSYASGANKHFSTSNDYTDVAGSPSSLSRGLQERSPVHRHRVDMSLAVGVSPTCSQEEGFRDHCHSFAPSNVQLLYAEGTAPVVKQRNSAFNMPSHQHQNYNPSIYQGTLDSRMGHLYSKSNYSNTIDGTHQRTFPFSGSMDMTSSPHSISGGTTYPSRMQTMQPGFVNPELRVRTSYTGGNLQKNNIWAERDLQFGTAKTNTELQYSTQRHKDLWVQSGQMSRDICVGSTRVDKEGLFDTVQTNSCLQERTRYGNHFSEQNAHAAALQQNISSNITQDVSINRMKVNQAARESSVTSKSALSEHISQTQNRSSNMNTEHAKSTVHIPPAASEVISQHQKSDDGMEERHALLDPNCDHPVTNVMDVDVTHNPPVPVTKDVDIYGPKSSPMPVSKDVDVESPKSPPMPVINDVFSLAPYCAYLDGKNNPFPTCQDWNDKNKISTTLFSQQPLSPGKNGKIGKELTKSGNITVINAMGPQSVKSQQTETLQTGEPQGVSYHQTVGETVVLDLSLKKSHQTSSSACNQENLFQLDREALPSLVTDNCLTKASDKMLHQGQEICKSQVTGRISHPGDENRRSQTSGINKNQENCQSQVTGRMSSLDQERCLCTKSVFNKGKESILPQVTETMTSQLRNDNPSQTAKCLPQHLHEGYRFQVTEKLSHQLQENCQSQAMDSLTRQNRESYPSQITESLPKQLRENGPSQATKSMHRQLQENYPSQAPKSMPLKLQESYKSQATMSLSHQENYPSWAKEMPHQGQSSCMSTTFPVHSLVACSPQPSNLSLFVSTIQTPITFSSQSVVLASSLPACPPNNIKLHSPQKHQSIESPGRRARNSLGRCRSITSPSGSENEANGFHSSKSFMFRKYKIMKFSSSGEEMQELVSDSSSRALPSPFPLPSDAVQSLPPSAPESSPTLGEANVSLASVGELSLIGPGQPFSELHRSVCVAITSSVVRSPSSLLKEWVEKTEEEERSKMPVKSKNGSRSWDHSTDSPVHAIWLAFDGVRLLLHKLLSQLETFMFTRSCPFSHVIRAGAIFIPIHLVKKVLFPELLGPSIDRILQKHKVELRPTTLSEEKLLREKELKDCPSRMLKLLALKQLPDVYPDLLNLFCGHSIQQQLGSRTQSEQHTHK
ncbi:uncharacterized protein C15orf39 homolog isoform X2 [Mixophyes fleayi]|uniref:uncharacterized protein C15orf39 homolog isoform X2 n=1 Tax=Mixophyes fleayi TaxID=3061075 RepID=UPI003F4DE21D